MSVKRKNGFREEHKKLTWVLDESIVVSGVAVVLAIFAGIFSLFVEIFWNQFVARFQDGGLPKVNSLLLWFGTFLIFGICVLRKELLNHLTRRLTHRKTIG